jgi:hypothetical protein
MPATIHASDIAPELARKIGVKTRAAGFNKEQVRSWALRVLAEMANLTQDQRRRVLDFAAKLNRL